MLQCYDLCFQMKYLSFISQSHLQIIFLEPPKIVISPRDLFQNETSTAMFECVANGEPQPSITWTMIGNGFSSARTRVLINNTLEIRNVDSSDNGSKYVR